MTFEDFFDPYNIDHIVACSHVMEHGTQPEGFIPDGTIMGVHWFILMTSKCTASWIKQAIAGNISGIPTP